ncbi:MAG: S-methyl-5'-thioadenosine phosphorylase [Planctomycetota bacterium]|nr:MAG: S-methyl-5'-thioadenosine phosphorylase [Planctomycetota bacterium]
MEKEIIGIIGGTGLYQMEGITITEEVNMETPFGKPSSPLFCGKIGEKDCIFLARHGLHHSILPHEINYCANIYALKKLGVHMICSVSAVGSMREDIHPGDMVFPHQFFDRTRQRLSTFFGNGIAAHISFAHPICKELSDILYTIALELGYTAHRGGTYLCMEGPQFSTLAESEIYRKWGVDIIGMTNLQEAKLAREAELCYATIALVTDYDCWHEEHEAVSVESVVEILKSNAQKAQKLLLEAVPKLTAKDRKCHCPEALQNAILTPKEHIPEETKDALWPIIGKYMT